RRGQGSMGMAAGRIDSRVILSRRSAAKDPVRSPRGPSPTSRLRMTRRMHARRKGILLIAGAALLWSSGGIGIKAIADSALKVTFYRSLFAAVALLLFLRRAQWRRTATFAAAVICYAA